MIHIGNWTEYFFEHAATRLKERYGLDFTKEKEKELVKAIKDNYLKYYIKKMGRRRRIFKVPIWGQEIWCVYSKEKKGIITFLPKGGKS